MLVVGWQEGHLACKKSEWWGAGVVICHCHSLSVGFGKIQIVFTFLVPAHQAIPGRRAIKRVCVVQYYLGELGSIPGVILKLTHYWVIFVLLCIMIGRFLSADLPRV